MPNDPLPTRALTRSPFTMVSDLALHHVSESLKVPAAGGETIVFLHALGCDLHLWETVAANFAGRHRVVRYDLRGHGLSDCGPPECSIEDHVRDLLGLLDRLSIPVATLVGVSVGGMIALALALRHRARVRRLVLCATAARLGTRESWTERMTSIRNHGLEGSADAILARWFTPSFATREPAVVRGFRNRLVRTPVGGYLATCAALRDADLRAEAAGLRVPALVIGGEHDTTVPPAAGREFMDVLPDAHWSLIHGAAHLVPVEQPAATTTVITRFFADTH
jgi:3-oxoadipate enol-lactonase